jgi:hypothetical protein
MFRDGIVPWYPTGGTSTMSVGLVVKTSS